MKTNLIKIGNSKGIRIPSHILKECDFKDKIELEVEKNKIILKAVSRPRANWDREFRKMHQYGDDKLIIDDEMNLSSEEWEWK